MVLICGACGNKMEVKSEVSDGQHIQCPFCGEKTKCNKPARIELPTGAVRRNRQETTHAESPPVEAPPVMKLKRPSDESDRQVDLNAQAIMRRMQMESEERAAAEGREIAARRKARMESAIKTGVVCLLVAICAAGGGWWYMKWQAEKRARDAEILRRRQIEEKKDAEERERAEAVRKRENAEREKAREQARLEREKKEDARRKVQETAQRVAAEKAAEIEKGKEKFAKAMDGFSETVVLPWRSLDKKKRPGAVDAIFTCLTLGIDGMTDVYEILSRVGGACEATLILPTGDTKEMSFSDLVEKMNKAGGLLRDDGCAYLFCPKERAKSSPLPSGTVNPAELRIGTELYWALVNKNKISKERLAFEVWLNVPGRKQPSLVKTVAFGETVRADEINEVLLKLAQDAAPKTSKKPRRRTVVMYDGAIIRRQLGVTLVPRNPRSYDSNYASLRDEARRQEREEEASVAEGNRKMQEAVENKFQALRELATLTITEKKSDIRDASNLQ